MDIKEKLEELNIDKGQIIIFTVIFLAIIFLCYGLFTKDNDEEKLSNVEINVPKIKSVKDYETKLDAYSRENEVKENKNTLNFNKSGIFGNDELTPREKLEREVDSLFNANKKDNSKVFKSVKNESYTDRAKRIKNNPQYNTLDKNKSIETKKINEKSKLNTDENNVDINDFFNNKVETNSNTIINNINIKPFRAVIHNDQIIKNNQRVTLRMIDNALINGEKYSKNTVFYAFAKFSENRVYLTINNINNNRVLIDAFDKQDGNRGLYVEGANIEGQIKQEGKEDVINDINVSNIPIGRTLKNIFRRSNNEIKVSLLNNYEIIIKSKI